MRSLLKTVVRTYFNNPALDVDPSQIQALLAQVEISALRPRLRRSEQCQVTLGL